MLRWLFLLSLLLLQTACDTPAETDRPGSSLLMHKQQVQDQVEVEKPVFEPLIATDLLNEPTPVYRFESTAEALSVWRRAEGRPTLLLLANNPHLGPVPDEQREATMALLNIATAEELATATTDRSSMPLILPGMAVDAALRNNWFNELVWALPLRDPAAEISLEKFIDQFTQSGFADEDEAASMALTDQTLHGSLRNTTFRAAALPHLQNLLQQPVILHIDLSYFQPLYKNEISTPLLDIVFKTLATLKEMQLKVQAVTFSYGHTDSQISLDVRFLGDVITYLIEDPARLDQPIPLNWQRQRDTLYLANFFKKEEVSKIFAAQEKDAPDQAWIKFNLYRSAAEHKEGNIALNYLAEAVSLDPIYAIEYTALSNLAFERGRPDEAFRMLTLASEAFPQDPFIKLQMVQLAQELGKKDAALRLLDQLRKLQWSDFYYPQMPDYLAGLADYVQSGQEPASLSSKSAEIQPAGSDVSASPEQPMRKRVLHSRE